MRNNLVTLVLGLLLAFFAVETVKTGIEVALNAREITAIDNLPDFSVTQDYSKKEFPAMIRIESEDTLFSKSRFHCSGTVISDDYVLTAAHCLTSNRGGLTRNKFRIVALDSRFETEGTPASLNTRADYALIKGDFRRFTKLRVQMKQELTIYSFGMNPLIFCGYPYASVEGVCYPLFKPQPFYFGFRGLGLIYPGMSGGPVLDTKTGEIVAVNTAMEETTVVVSPLVAIFDNLGVKVVP